MSQTNPKPNWLTAISAIPQRQDTASGRIRFGVALKMITSIVVILLIVASVQIVFSYRTTSQNVQEEAEHTLASYFLTYQTKINTESRAAEAIAISIADREDVQTLYLNGDRDGLYTLLSPMFAEFKEREIVHLYIENPDGTVFLRVHNPDSFGDDVTYRNTAKTALLEKRVISGVEIGPSRLGVRAVTPMYTPSGKFIGMVEVGLDFDENFIADLKELTGADFTMWVSYEVASIANLKPVEGIPDSPLDELFYYASTNPELALAESDLYQSVYSSGQSKYLINGENTPNPTIVYVTPLLGYNDKLFGLLQVSEPYTTNIKSQNQALLSTLGVVGGLTIISIFLIWLLVSTIVLRPLNALSRFAEKQTAGEYNTRVTLRSNDEFEQLAETYNTQADAVEQERRTLEQRVADRTKALSTSAEVTRRLATVLDPRQLTKEVVNEVRNAFDYYYAQIYLLDEAGENLVLTGGTGEAGASMVARGHSVPKGRGLVGRAAETNMSVLIPDVSQEEGWLPNELLPETKAETAIPISVGNQVLGVLDVQHSLVNGLTTDDVTLLESLAGQVAISLQNARSYEQSRKQAELESLINVIGQRIQRTTSVEDTLQTAIRELGTAIGASRVKASLRSTSSAIATTPVALADSPVAVVEGEEGAFDTEPTTSD